MNKHTRRKNQWRSILDGLADTPENAKQRAMLQGYIAQAEAKEEDELTVPELIQAVKDLRQRVKALERGS